MRTTTPERILVLAAHPDDDVIGCGGTVIQHIDAGDEVRITYTSSGEAGNWDTEPTILGPKREQEAARAADILGIGKTSLIFLRHPDKSIAKEASDIIPKVAQIITDFQPGRVYLPHANDGHPDHEAVHDIGMKALRTVRNVGSLANSATVLGYEIWKPITAPDVYQNIPAATLDRKITAMRTHLSQLVKTAYDRMILEAATRRGKDSGIYQYAEVFADYSSQI